MPGLVRGKDGCIGILATAADINGASNPQIVPVVFGLASAYPVSRSAPMPRPVTATSGNVANAVATATIPAVAGKTAYISGFTITGAGATAALIVNPTLTGVISGTKTYVHGAVAGVAALNPVLDVQFCPPIPASAVNTAIAVACPALGAGNTNNTVNAYGFYL
jgi:hypothetical protein